MVAASLLILPMWRATAADEIATDRPAVTDSSVVVPVGMLQLENGVTDTVSQGQAALDGPETLLRFGVASKTELRADVPDYYGAGFGDPALGVKQQLGPAPGGFDVSVVLTLSLPTGARTLSSHGYDPSVQLPWSRSLPANWTAAGMFSVYGRTESGRRDVTGETTFLLDRALTKHSDAFVEYAGDFPEEGRPSHLLHGGAAWRVRPQQQLDFHVGVGVSRAAVDRFVGIGYSFRFRMLQR